MRYKHILPLKIDKQRDILQQEIVKEVVNRRNI
jgi:hypothetical protein